MRMFVDVQQYALTVASLMPGTLVAYAVLYWLAKYLAKASGSFFGLSMLGHVMFICIACAIAPIAALWLVNRPAELQTGKALLAGSMAALAALVAAQECGPASEASPSRGLGIRLLSGTTAGGIAGLISFVFFSLALKDSPRSQVDFGLGVLLFFVIVGMCLGALLIGRRPNKSRQRTLDE